jgi:hypothetical protein
MPSLRAYDNAPTAIALARLPPPKLVTCPCCGSKVKPLPFAIDLNTNVLIIGQRAFRLTPQMAVFISVLHNAMPRTVSYDAIIRAMHGVNEPSRAFDAMKVIASACRRLLRGQGWVIVGISKRGYKLLPYGAYEEFMRMPAIRGGNRIASIGRGANATARQRERPNSRTDALRQSSA